MDKNFFLLVISLALRDYRDKKKANMVSGCRTKSIEILALHLVSPSVCPQKGFQLHNASSAKTSLPATPSIAHPITDFSPNYTSRKLIFFNKNYRQLTCHLPLFTTVNYSLLFGEKTSQFHYRLDCLNKLQKMYNFCL